MTGTGRDTANGNDSIIAAKTALITANPLENIPAGRDAHQGH